MTIKEGTVLPEYRYRCDDCNLTMIEHKHMNEDHSPPKCSLCGKVTYRIWSGDQEPIYVGEDFTLSADSKESVDVWEDQNHGRVYSFPSGS